MLRLLPPAHVEEPYRIFAYALYFGMLGALTLWVLWGLVGIFSSLGHPPQVLAASEDWGHMPDFLICGHNAIGPAFAFANFRVREPRDDESMFDGGPVYVTVSQHPSTSHRDQCCVWFHTHELVPIFADRRDSNELRLAVSLEFRGQDDGTPPGDDIDAALTVWTYISRGDWEWSRSLGAIETYGASEARGTYSSYRISKTRGAAPGMPGTLEPYFEAALASHGAPVLNPTLPDVKLNFPHAGEWPIFSNETDPRSPKLQVAAVYIVVDKQIVTELRSRSALGRILDCLSRAGGLAPYVGLIFGLVFVHKIPKPQEQVRTELKDELLTLRSRQDLMEEYLDI